MLAPYWAPTDLRSFVNGPSKVFYHIYEGPGSNAMLKKATADVFSVFSSKLPQGKNFTASWVLVVTWQDIRHQLQNDITKNLVRLSEYMDINIQNKISFWLKVIDRIFCQQITLFMKILIGKRASISYESVHDRLVFKSLLL